VNRICPARNTTVQLSTPVHCGKQYDRLKSHFALNTAHAANGATMAAQLLRCIDDVSRWLSSNRLKLNVDKTQFIWLGAPRQLQQVSSVQLVIDGVPVSTADTLRDLGVTLDTRLSFQQHVDSVVRSCL